MLYESFVSGQICFHFFFLRSPGIAFMRISEMGAAMFIMHVDRHFPIWTTYSCSFRQTVPQKNQKKNLTQIFTWKFPWWSCAGVFECLKTYINSACTGGIHRSPYLCINLFAAYVGHFDAKNAIFTHHRGSTGGAQGPGGWWSEWVSLQGVYEGVVWLFYIPGGARFLPFNSILISTNTTDPSIKGQGRVYLLQYTYGI